jgi:Rieske Fe-S protein
MSTPTNRTPSDDSRTNRRQLLSWAAVATALAASYGTLAAFIGRFLYPEPADEGWFFVSLTSDLRTGEAQLFKTPRGEPVNVTRQGPADADIAALSSTCPHLGCQVHWEGHNNRFFCPCHNGVFDPNGVATAGPPAEAGQSLLRYPMRSDRGMLFIQLPSEEVAALPQSVRRQRGMRRLERAEAAGTGLSFAGACLAPPSGSATPTTSERRA